MSDYCPLCDTPNGMHTRFCSANPSNDRPPAPVSDELELRRMLAWSYSGHHLYCDDGELQDSQEHPFIDFKRDTIAELKRKMEERGLNRLYRQLHPDQPPFHQA